MNKRLKNNNVDTVCITQDWEHCHKFEDSKACEQAVKAELCTVDKKWTQAEVDAVAAKHCNRFDSIEEVSVTLVNA